MFDSQPGSIIFKSSGRGHMFLVGEGVNDGRIKGGKAGGDDVRLYKGVNVCRGKAVNVDHCNCVGFCGVEDSVGNGLVAGTFD